MYHLIGIETPRMQSLANLLKELGMRVDGSSLTKLNLDIVVNEYAAENITSDMFIVYGDHIQEDNIELIKANELNLKIYSYQELVNKIANMFVSFAISGSHGKTTIARMLAYLFKETIGTNYLDDHISYINKEIKHFIFEASSLNKMFLEYTPDYAIINNINLEKDKYDDIDALLEAYREFGNNTKKMVFAKSEDSYTHYLDLNKPVFYYGLSPDDDIYAYNVCYNEDGTNFDVQIEGNYYGHFDLPIYTKHMLLNALAVITISSYMRLEAKEVNSILKKYVDEINFLITEKEGLTVMKSYVQTPTELKMNIRYIEQKYPDDRQLVIVTDLEEEDNLLKTLKLGDISYDENVSIEKLMRYKNAKIIFLLSKDYPIYEEYLKYLKDRS